jgi:hypothetical protein
MTPTANATELLLVPVIFSSTHPNRFLDVFHINLKGTG